MVVALLEALAEAAQEVDPSNEEELAVEVVDTPEVEEAVIKLAQEQDSSRRRRRRSFSISPSSSTRRFGSSSRAEEKVSRGEAFVEWSSLDGNATSR